MKIMRNWISFVESAVYLVLEIRNKTMGDVLYWFGFCLWKQAGGFCWISDGKNSGDLHLFWECMMRWPYDVHKKSGRLLGKILDIVGRYNTRLKRN